MRCFQVDFQEEFFLNSTHSFQLNVSYILSDSTVYTGHTVSMLFLAERIKKISLIKRVKIVVKFLKHIPEMVEMLDGYMEGHKEYCKMKNIPKTVIVAKKKFDMAMDAIITDWIEWFEMMLNRNGYFSLRNCLETDVLSFILQSQAEKDEFIKLGEDVETGLRELFAFKGLPNYENKTIWLLPEGFYSQEYFDDDIITSFESIEVGKPFLIPCLKMPNLNLLSSIEMKIIKENVNTRIAAFREVTDEWATKCYTSKDGVTYFKERLMSEMAGVQEAIDNDPFLKQWSNLDGVQHNSTIYFGEVSPLILWKYYKNNLVISEESYQFLLNGYELIENHTVPIMVFAYKREELEWYIKEEDQVIQQEMVESVRKHMEV